MRASDTTTNLMTTTAPPTRVSLRLAPGEYEALTAAAASQATTVSGLIRAGLVAQGVGLGDAAPVRPSHRRYSKRAPEA